MTKPVYKIFCDESCHLEHDGADIMVLGGLCCTDEKATALTKHIKWLRHQHGYQTELKWTKLHSKQLAFYKALLDLVIDDPEVWFKATVVQHKERLAHEHYNDGSHNVFYYKMFFYTLRDFLSVENQYRIYMDYMDTMGGEKTKKLCEVLQTEGRKDVEVQPYIVQSYESQLIQLVDLIIGAVGYKNRNDIEHSSTVKMAIVEYIETKLGHSLDYGTPPWERNFNIFRFAPHLIKGN